MIEVDPSYRTYRNTGWLYPAPLTYSHGYRGRIQPDTGKAISMTRGQAISGISGDYDYTENYQQGFGITPLLIGAGVGVLAVLALTQEGQRV